MFVEIVRLFIVLWSTAAGYALGHGSRAFGDSTTVVASTLGASLGYVAGGVFGRILGRAMGVVEARVERAPAAQLLAGGVGALVVGGLMTLVGAVAVLVMPDPWGWPVLGLLAWVGTYSGARIGTTKSAELLALAGLSTRPLATATRYEPAPAPDALLVDTSAVIDGRLLGMAREGFLQQALLVPRFVLDELRGIAEAADPERRRRGRRGLETLDALRRETNVHLSVVDDELPELDDEDVDTRLLALGRRLNAGLLTTDAELTERAEQDALVCLNLHRLADVLRPVHVPGEVVRLPITREGKEPGQGVGFLDDGTMVVVGDAAALVGSHVDVRITSNVQTSVGRMLFASLATT